MFRSRLKVILEAMVGRVVTPGDVVNLTKLPRYEVLATFHVLEALNIIEVVNAKGNYRVYKLTDLGLKLLRALQKFENVVIDVKTEVASEEVASGNTSEEAEAAT